MPQATSNYVKIGDIELSSKESLDSLMEKAMRLYVWKMEAKQAKKSGEDIDLEMVFDEGEKQAPEEKKEYVGI